MANQTGTLKLTFRKKENGITYVPQASFTYPMRVMSPFYEDDDGTAFIYLLNLGGGVVGGDELITDVTVEENAKALLTTTSSNKLYRMVPDRHATIINKFKIGSNSVLEYYPESNIPFTESETIQLSEFHLNKSSYLFTVDSVTPGRIDRGEFFSYRRYASNVKIFVDGRLIAYEKTNLKPENETLTHIGIMEVYSDYGSIYVYHQSMDESFAKSVNTLIENSEGIAGGVTLIESRLAVIRLLGQNTRHMDNVIEKIWDVSRQSFLGKSSVGLRKGK